MIPEYFAIWAFIVAAVLVFPSIGVLSSFVHAGFLTVVC
jgi:hypothetical protein